MKKMLMAIGEILLVAVFTLSFFNTSYAQNPSVTDIQNRLKQRLQSRGLPQEVAKCPQCGTELKLNLEKRKFYCPNAECGKEYPKDHKCEEWKCADVKKIALSDTNFIKVTIANSCVTMNTFRYVIKTKVERVLDSGELDYPGVYEKTVPTGSKLYIYSIPNQRIQPNVGNNIKIYK